ncbi:hypothetical protein ACVWXU_000330 [Streptomyces sp. TE33382]
MSCGTRAQDFRPGDPDGAWLLRSSLWDQSLTHCWYCSVACGSATLFGSQPRRPLCVFSGLEPHCRTSRCVRPQPTPSPRYCSLASLLGTANRTCGYCAYWTAVLLAVAPDYCGPPGPVVSPVAVLQPLWLRNSTTAPPCELQLRVLLPGSSFLPGPAVSLGYERNHNHTTTRCLLRPPQILAIPKRRQPSPPHPHSPPVSPDREGMARAPGDEVLKLRSSPRSAASTGPTGTSHRVRTRSEVEQMTSWRRSELTANLHSRTAWTKTRNGPGNAPSSWPPRRRPPGAARPPAARLRPERPAAPSPVRPRGLSGPFPCRAPPSS